MTEIAATNIVASQVPKVSPTSMANARAIRLNMLKELVILLFLGLNFCPILWALTGVRMVYKASYMGLRKNAVSDNFFRNAGR